MRSLESDVNRAEFELQQERTFQRSNAAERREMYDKCRQDLVQMGDHAKLKELEVEEEVDELCIEAKLLELEATMLRLKTSFLRKQLDD